MSPAVQPQKPERVLPILGIALLLFVMIGAVGALVWQRSRTVDARETMTTWFEAGELPFTLVPVESAELANGDRVLRLMPAGGIVEPERKPAPPEQQPGKSGEKPADGSGMPFVPFDWSKVDVRAPGDPPCEVFLVRYPLAAAGPRAKELFEVGVQGGPGMLPPSGGRAVLDRGQLTWREWSAPYVLEREYELGGTVRDTLRVNLSRENDSLICFARFPRGSSASPKKVEELLAALAPK